MSLGHRSDPVPGVLHIIGHWRCNTVVPLQANQARHSAQQKQNYITWAAYILQVQPVILCAPLNLICNTVSHTLAAVENMPTAHIHLTGLAQHALVTVSFDPAKLVLDADVHASGTAGTIWSGRCGGKKQLHRQ